MKNIYDSPALSALRALDDSPAMKAIRAIEDSPVMQMMRNLDDSPAIHAIRELENSSAMQAIRQIEESPVMRMMRDLEQSPTLKAIRNIEESPAFKAIRQLQDSPAIKAIQALESSPIMEAFSRVAEQVTSGYGALTFSEAYELLVDEYKERVEGDALEPLNGLAEAVKDRAARAPFGPLSADFYLSLIFALFLFYLAQTSAEQSEEKMLKRMDGLEQTISIQLNALRESEHRRMFLVADRSVNLRVGPGSEYEVLDVLPRNQKAVQLDMSGEWTKVEYFDYVRNETKIGWAHGQYFITVVSDDE